MALGLLNLERMTSNINNFSPPHKNLDPIAGPIVQLAENLRSIEDHLDRFSIPTTTRGDNPNMTSLSTVNAIVDKCNIVALAAALQTQFHDQQPSADPQSDE